MVRYHKRPEFTVSTAGQHSMLVKVRCGLCRVTRLYHPDDIIALIGDVAIWDIAPRFSCETCKSREYLKADWTHIAGPDVGKTRIRRLVRVRYIRVPVWKDEVI